MMIELTSTQLLQMARERTGLDDFGDESFRPGFEALVSSIQREATLSDEGRIAMRERLLRLLSNRLRSQRDLERHPEILDEPLVPPVVVISLPRVGSTKLHRMLSASDEFLGLLFWQGYNPAPFDGPVVSGPDPRIDAAVQFLRWRARSNPAADVAHHMEAMAPEEEMYLLELSFRIYWPIAYMNVPSYLEWVRAADPDPVYAGLRQMLQYVQWQFHRASGKPWVLKAPPNLGFEPYIARHFPGARFIVLHRDPVKVIPSVAALSRETRKLYSADPPDDAEQGSWALDEFSGAMRRHLQWRGQTPDAPLLDIAYRDVRSRDMDVMRKIYEFLELPLSPRAEESMVEWSRQNTQHRHGRHEYSLDQSGLTENRIDLAFSDYRKRFAEYLGE